TTMTNLFRPQGAFGWFSYTTSRDTIVSTHGKYLLALPRPTCVSVLAATVGVFFNLMVLIAEVLLKTQGCIHNE
ncbi:hypothetical protein, partial [Pseudomonas putida]|uniref:hypothetical protein n=1 Tax=Pseudomonas putida TaxID=303 RepID=UPI003D693434